MSLIWRTLPADWPRYTHLDGSSWALGPNGFWWLNWGDQWHQAASLSVGDVHGIAVPPDILRRNKAWLNNGVMTSNEIRAALSDFSTACAEQFTNLTAHHERQITRTFLMPPGVHPGSSASGTGQLCSSPVEGTALAPIAAVYPALAAPADVPPDFAEIPLGPGCCAQCHLDDGPLYEGRLCRYCWILAQQTFAQPEEAAEGDPAELIWKAIFVRERRIASLIVLFVMLAMYIAVFVYR